MELDRRFKDQAVALFGRTMDLVERYPDSETGVWESTTILGEGTGNRFIRMTVVDLDKHPMPSPFTAEDYAWFAPWVTASAPGTRHSP